MYFKRIESPLEKCSREKIISSISLPIQESIKVMDSTKNTTGSRPEIRPEVKLIENRMLYDMRENTPEVMTI